jgi:predicted acyltransferase
MGQEFVSQGAASANVDPATSPAPTVLPGGAGGASGGQRSAVASGPTMAAGSGLRLTSLDAFRGLVMFLMLAEVLRLSKLVDLNPESGFLQWLKFHTTHVAWVGCSLHDLIQPGFSFLVGAALPFSLFNRQRQGHVTAWLYWHAAWRSLLLVALGIFVRSLNSSATNFTFEDTLTQIGLGYFFLFLVGVAPRWVAPAALVGILVAYWTAFAMYRPLADFDYAAVGVAADWEYHRTGLASAWNKNSNLAWAFDTWFLNLFPRPEVFLYHPGGYATLSFIPTLGTMIMGLLAGRWLLEEPRPAMRLGMLIAAALVGLLGGWLLDHYDLCPLVKRIWTPSFALWSGGWCFLITAVLHGVCDLLGWRRWAFPWVVIGCNCILIYLLNWTVKGSIMAALHRHLGTEFFELLGPAFADLLTGGMVLLVFWLFLYWLYRQRIFVKI